MRRDAARAGDGIRTALEMHFDVTGLRLPREIVRPAPDVRHCGAMAFRSRPVAVPVPRLDDGVVRLRPPAEEDAEAIYTGCQDPDIGRFTAMPVPYEFHHATDWIEQAPRSWERASATPMVILDSKTGELLGGCGLLEMRPDRAEIGYWVKREARGRGVATRAVSLLTDWALAEPVLHLALVELLADVRQRRLPPRAREGRLRVRGRDASAHPLCRTG